MQGNQPLCPARISASRRIDPELPYGRPRVELVQEFAKRINARIAAVIPRDGIVQQAEVRRKTVISMRRKVIRPKHTGSWLIT